MKYILSLIWISIFPYVCFPNTHKKIQAQSVNDFLNSIGANSSINKRGENLEKTIECTRYLGIRWLRSGYEDGTTMEVYKRLRNEAGIKFTYGLGSGGNNISQLLNGAREIAALDALLAIEGNNEPNNWGIEYQGEKGGKANTWMPLAKLQRDLYYAVKNDPLLKKYPVFGISESGGMTDNVGLQYLRIPKGANTSMPDGTQYADYVNIHNYITHPSWDNGKIHDNQTWISSSPFSDCKVDGLYNNHGLTWYKKHKGYNENELAALPKVTTETGLVIDENISEEQHGKLLLNLYLAQFKRGWSYPAIYILRDRSDEGGNQKFGFYTPNYTPRKAAIYLHNLTTILEDNKPTPKPGSLSYYIPNQPETVHDLLLQKSDGTYELIIWGEKYTGGTDTIDIHFKKRYKSISIYNPLIGTDATQTLSKIKSLKLKLTDHPIIIEITE